MVFDLTGDGTTVLKGNYGLYWHNPGVGVAERRQPEHRHQVGDLRVERHSTAIGAGSRARRRRCRRRRSKARFSSIRTSRRRTRTKRRAGSSGSSAETIGVRAGFVYKTEDDLIALYIPARGLECIRRAACRSPSSTSASTACAARPTIACSLCRPAVGQCGDAVPDDAGGDEPAAVRALQDGRDVDQQALRQPVVGLDRRRLHLDDRLPERLSRRTRTSRASEDRTVWSFKASGSYDAPFGIRLSPVLRHQSGVELRAHQTRSTFPAGVTGHGHGDLRGADERQPRRQHLGVRRAMPRRRSNFTDRARARGCSSICSTSRTATRRRRSAAPRARATRGRRSWRRSRRGSASGSSGRLGRLGR